MARREIDLAHYLEPDVAQDVYDIRRQVMSVRHPATKLALIFNDSLLSQEWIGTSDLVVVSGLSRLFVHTGVAVLLADEAIEGTSMPVVTYYERLRQRDDKAARLLTALSAARIDCPPDEVPLAALLRSDVERTDSEGQVSTVPATGYYFKSRNEHDNLAQDVPPVDVLSVR